MNFLVLVKFSQRNVTAANHVLITKTGTGGKDRPSPPQNVHAEDIDGESLTLCWLAPKDNGGSEITNYVIEKREAGSINWARISSFISGTAYRIRNLVINHRYDFRVMAENQYGTSDPGITSEPVTAKLPFGKY
ncbi:twitchin-like [Centruroides sculpturatus]|uniref:twitchin-like n=1 Tax=Centruroides sculpturatus TaxID=218467 RepID=UPI000C6DB2FC|nr:twitchin-like [Centruroides sculpturatus]